MGHLVCPLHFIEMGIWILYPDNMTMARRESYQSYKPQIRKLEIVGVNI